VAEFVFLRRVRKSERIDVKTTLSEREGNTVKLAVEVSGDELQEAFDTHLKQVAKEVRIPGFRQGKVPLTMVRQRLGDQAILIDAVDDAMGRWFATAALELGIDPVDRPQIDVGDDLPELGQTFSFTASVTVMPEVELGRYKGVEVPREADEVTTEEVDSQMDRLRNEFAELKPVEGRPAQNDDFVTADFRAEIDGQSVEGLEATDFVFEVGAGRLFKEVEEAVVGMNAGDTKTSPLTLPEGFPEDLAGKTAEFTITVKEIKEKVLPPLTDLWASEVSEFPTLLELRQEIRGKMQVGKTYSADQRFRSLAVKAVADNATLDLPDVVVREQAEELLADFKRSLEAQGGDFEAYMAATGTTVEQMIDDLKPGAANNVKTGLVLDAVAKAEGIEASDEDVQAAVAQMAAAGRVDAKTFENRLRKTGRLQAVGWQIVRDKAADFIAANAVPLTEGAAAVAEAKEALAKVAQEKGAVAEKPEGAGEAEAAPAKRAKAGAPKAAKSKAAQAEAVAEAAEEASKAEARAEE
jgi:trigger factor